MGCLQWCAVCEMAESASSTAVSAGRYRHDWYQNGTHVILSVYAKGVAKGDVVVEMDATSCVVRIKVDGGASEWALDLDPLAQDVVPEESGYEVLGTKIEVSLKKKVAGVQWGALEGRADAGAGPAVRSAQVGVTVDAAGGAGAAGIPAAYAHRVQRDWSKIERDVEEEDKNEKLEGEAALNRLFQDIYGKASDETRRAMNKSYQESGGTVLSTNWSEVGSKKVELAPPDGMEAKKYEQ